MLSLFGISADNSYLAICFGRMISMTVLLVKAGLLVVVQIWIRWTLPRLRIDQVMTTCLKYLVPMSCFLFLGTVLWPLALASAFEDETGSGPTSVWAPTGDRVPIPQQTAGEEEEDVSEEPNDDSVTQLDVVSVNAVSGGAE